MPGSMQPQCRFGVILVGEAAEKKTIFFEKFFKKALPPTDGLIEREAKKYFDGG